MKKSIITLLVLSGLIAGQNAQAWNFNFFGNEIISSQNGIRISQTGIANETMVRLDGIDDMTVKGKSTGLWGTKTFDFTIKNGKLISRKSSTIEEWQYSGYVVALVAIGACGYLIYKMVSAENKEKDTAIQEPVTEVE
jgi:hypothetical protein